jgi:hypothetical protein
LCGRWQFFPWVGERSRIGLRAKRFANFKPVLFEPTPFHPAIANIDQQATAYLNHVA